MRKIIAVITGVLMVFTLAACGKNEEKQPLPEENIVSDSPASPAQGESEEIESTDSRILIAYFSMPEDVNISGVDAVASASIVVRDGERQGNTEFVAKRIQETVGGDLFRIETVQGYPLDHDPLVDQAADEQDESLRPELAGHIENMEQYDTVILGYPNWWGDLPMPIYTFLEEYDFSGKAIIPFVTHGGSGFSDTRNTISELQPGADISENTLSLSRNDVAESEAEIRQWAESLNLKSDMEEISAGTENMQTESNKTNLSGTVPEELEYIPAEYKSPSEHPGTLEKLTYQTWESFSYEERTQELTKEAWVYLPYGYSEDQKYNVFYLSHGGWSNETTVMGTDQNPRSFKYVIDHAIEDGQIQPLIIVLPTYNNTSGRDSGDYSLALQLTDQFHNELINDLIPAVESKYSTYAEDTTLEGLRLSRDHRGFGGFSMGSVNTWCTFRYALDYFRYFMPMSGSYSADGEYMAELVKESGHGPEDFFIFAASGTDDFAYSAFKAQVMAMGNVPDKTFLFADNEADGNLSFLEREGYVHDATASDEYTYNGLRFFWNRE
jgi:flavodoxin/predicted alpha/beta superfamily hydrolase/predicted small lipoprotein YifL